MAETAPRPLVSTRRKVDSTRASRDGHAYHEAWAARSALELLHPKTSLKAIALEGFSVVDSDEFSDGAHQIADTVHYHGAPAIDEASRVEVIQFKYSIASRDVPVRAADLAATLGKFAEVEAEFVAGQGETRAEQMARYVYQTNRPIHPELYAALAQLATGAIPISSTIAAQADQLVSACQSLGARASNFLGRVSLVGVGGTLVEVEGAARRQIANWSAPDDPESEKRLLKLRGLIRNKAGGEGHTNNLIDRVAVLAELGVDHESQLYPSEDAFPEVARVLRRACMDDLLELVATSTTPVLVHGAGGMGKTVLMQGLAEILGGRDTVVLFDGFGAGRWRDPSDGRDRPERTLVHLANLLAGQGLSDILLPINDESSLLRAFRRRLCQAAEATRSRGQDGRVVLLLDAIDHAAIEATARGRRSFAQLLLTSLTVDPIAGIVVVASCRTERRQLTVGDIACQPFAIPKLTSAETRALALARDPILSGAEITALAQRSGGNPRCLDALIREGRPYDAARPSGPDAAPGVVLDEMLLRRLDRAKAEAKSRGAGEADLRLLLAGLALLPPPTPLTELAVACGLSDAAVESFASDLAPLLERTPHGLMFRDEPTETLIRNLAAGDQSSRAALQGNLGQRQAQSTYAARALPTLLTEFDDADSLVRLAYDPRLPEGVTKVSGQEIQLRRVLAAQAACARHGRIDDLLGLLLEASRIAAGHERADQLIYDFPDLAAISDDPDMLRRLFANQMGWAGGRHARLAIAELMIDDNASAWLNAARAIDWYNWSIGRNPADDDDPALPAEPLDVVGFALVVFCERNPQEILRWLAQGDRDAALDKLGCLFDLAERLASGFPHRREGLDRVAAVLARLGRGSQPILLTALKYSSGRASLDIRLLRALAAAPLVRGGNRYAFDRETSGASLEMLLAAARACHHRLRAEAKVLASVAIDRRPDCHDFDNFAENITAGALAVLFAGVSAAACGRAVSPIDLAPEDLLKRVPKSVRARGPKAFEAAVDRITSARPTSTPVRRQPFKRPDEYLQRLGRTWSSRIRPLAPIADVVRRVCLARTVPAKRALVVDHVTAAITRIRKGCHDGEGRFRAGVSLGALFPLLDALGALDDVTAQAFAEAYQSDLYAPVSQLIAMTTRLSRTSGCEGAAQAFAALAHRAISSETNVELRISALGDLARAVWRTSSSEATAYFRRALDLAEAMGSDDFDRFHGVLSLCHAYSGDPLPQPVGQTLGRVLELSLNDAGRFPWSDYAQAMVRVAGASSLAIASRLDDRGHAGLNWPFPPLLERLVVAGQVRPQVAGALIGLTQVTETRAWGIASTVAAVAPKIRPAERERLFEWALTELDREYQARPYSVSITQIAPLVRQWLTPSSPARLRIEAFERGLQASGSTSAFATADAATETADLIDFRDAGAIDRALAHRDVEDGVVPTRLLRALANRATSIDDRLAFLNALAAASEPNLSDVLRALEEILPAWSASSMAIHDALPAIGKVLAAKHAHSLAAPSWQASSSLHRLKAGFRLGSQELIPLLCQTLQSSADDVSGDGWLQLASDLAPQASARTLGVGIERFLEHARDGLPADAGEGPWRADFSAPADADATVASLLWRLLGHHSAAQRWRAAHALRRLAELGEWRMLSAVVAHFRDTEGGAFVDPHLPFFVLNARLWLLIALARIAKDHPTEVAAFRNLLERAAFDDEFPHVAFQLFAGQALREIASILQPAEAAALTSRLDELNHSRFPAFEPSHDDWALLHQSRPDPARDRDDRFRLDYEFEKYQVTDLVRLFGVPGWQIEDAIADFAERWGAEAKSMFDCARAPSWDHNRGTWRMGLPAIDRYGGYVAWHGLMTTAGRLFTTRPLIARSWESDSWSAFRSGAGLSRPDGYWLADATDWSDPAMAQELVMPGPKDPEDREQDATLLLPLIGLSDSRRLDDELVIDGFWRLTNHLEVGITTILASPADAETIAWAALTGPPFFRGLPDPAEPYHSAYAVTRSAEAWLEKGQRGDRELDRHDPYGSPSARARSKPSEAVIAMLDLKAADPIVRSWSDGTGRAFLAEAWGAEGGRDDQHWDNSGDRLTVRSSLLKDLLRRRDRVLVGSVRARLYLEKPFRADGEDDINFIFRSVGFVVCADGTVTVNTLIPEAAERAVEALPRHDQADFGARCRAIHRLYKRS